jgi:hypothetical protein
VWRAALHPRRLVAFVAAAVLATVVAGAARPADRARDTRAPSRPAALVVERVTRTAVALTWRAARDDVRVVGYRLYVDGVFVNSTPHTRATLGRLTCGHSYVVGAAAFDRAKNVSSRTTRRVSTAECADKAPSSNPPAPTPAPAPAPAPVPPSGGGGGGGAGGGGGGSTPAPTPTPTPTPSPTPSGPASVFVATTGNDANACTQSAPCRSFNRAYRVAHSGDIVEVAAGSYGDQDLRFDSTKTSSSDVVFRTASGASVTIGQLDFGPDRFTGGASHVTVQDMTLTGDVSIPGCGVPDNTACPADASSPGDDLTFRNLRVKGPYAFYCASCSNVSLIGGTWGPDTYQCRSGLGSAHPEIQSAYTQVKRAHGILIDGVSWQNFARCTSADHTECLQVEPADDLTIRNSIFRKCDTIVVNLANDLSNSKSAAGYDAPNNVLIENNVFSEATDNTGGPTWYALNIRECSNCTIRYNSWLQAPRMPDGETHLNVKFIGNAGPFSSAGCLGGVTFSHNVWQGASCSATDRNVASLGFTNAAALDLRLLAGSPAVDWGDTSSFPAQDADGKTRTGTPDAGAYER